MIGPLIVLAALLMSSLASVPSSSWNVDPDAAHAASLYRYQVLFQACLTENRPEPSVSTWTRKHIAAPYGILPGTLMSAGILLLPMKIAGRTGQKPLRISLFLKNLPVRDNKFFT